MRRVVLFLLAGLAFSAHAQLYKWTDSEGRIHYSDLPQHPSTKGVKETKLFSNVIQTDDMPFEMKESARKNPITLYTFDKCGEPCKLAQELLDKRGVPYIIKNGIEFKAELQKLGSADKMPVILIGSKVIRQGFLESSWNRALDEAGYPKSNPLANLRKKTVKAPPDPEKTPAALAPTLPAEQ